MANSDRPGYFLRPPFFVATTIHNDNGRLRTELGVITESLTLVPTPEPEVRELMDTLAQIKRKESQNSLKSGRTIEKNAKKGRSLRKQNPSQQSVQSLVSSRRKSRVCPDSKRSAGLAGSRHRRFGAERKRGGCQAQNLGAATGRGWLMPIIRSGERALLKVDDLAVSGGY